MAESKGADFFISYNHRDQAWAEWIAWQVEASGFFTIIQAWDFRPGSNFVLSMQDGLSRAKRVILVLSEHFLLSNFPQTEWASIFTADPRGSESRLVPVRVSKCELTGLLKAIIYIDLVGKDESIARQDLIAGLSQGRAKPENCPPFPAGLVPQFPPGTPASPAEVDRTKFRLLFAGSIESLDASTVGHVLDRVRLLAQDESIRLLEIRAGSIHMTFDGSLEGIGRLRRELVHDELLDGSKLVRGLHLKDIDFSEAKIKYSVQLKSAFIEYERQLRDAAYTLLTSSLWLHGDPVIKMLEYARISMEASYDYSPTAGSSFISTVESHMRKRVKMERGRLEKVREHIQASSKKPALKIPPVTKGHSKYVYEGASPEPPREDRKIAKDKPKDPKRKPD